MKEIKQILLVLISIIILSEVSFSQVGIYPQVVFMNLQNRSSNLRIMNSSDQPKEITIDLEFGYTGYDSLGITKIFLGDSLLVAKNHSAVPFVKVFPKKLILKGKEEQVVKFMAGNVANLEDGTYYAKIHIVAKNPKAEIDTTFDKTKVSTKLDFVFNLMSTMLFEKGKPKCDLKIKGVSSYCDSASVYFLTGFERTGNSPFLGTADVSVYDMVGNKLYQIKDLTPIYFDTKKAFKFDKKKFNKGQYRVDILMSNEHKDIPSEYKIQVEPVKGSFIVNVDGIF
jgi:hypothetical protein